MIQRFSKLQSTTVSVRLRNSLVSSTLRSYTNDFCLKDVGHEIHACARFPSRQEGNVCRVQNERVAYYAFQLSRLCSREPSSCESLQSILPLKEPLLESEDFCGKHQNWKVFLGIPEKGSTSRTSS